MSLFSLEPSFAVGTSVTEMADNRSISELHSNDDNCLGAGIAT